MTLEPIDPETAVELYLKHKENELAAASLQSHEYRLDQFVRWCDKENISNLNTLTGRQLHEYRVWRRNDGDLSPASEKTQMDTIRVFVRYLESIDGVERNLSEKVTSPTLSHDQNSRDEILYADEAKDVIGHLAKYEYATLEHVTLALMWHTSMRTGGLRTLDVSDYNSSEQYVEVRHRPQEDTPIKNQADGERLIALSDQLCDLLDDWIADQRPSVTDSYDRKPLLATAQGRASKSTIRFYSYRWTQPCRYNNECPHDRDPAECESRKRDKESTCPSSLNPHAIRRGSITHDLNSEMPGKMVSDRANVSQRVIEEHYDQRTEREKMNQRRDYLSNI